MLSQPVLYPGFDEVNANISSSPSSSHIHTPLEVSLIETLPPTCPASERTDENKGVTPISGVKMGSGDIPEESMGWIQVLCISVSLGMGTSPVTSCTSPGHVEERPVLLPALAQALLEGQTVPENVKNSDREHPCKNAQIKLLILLGKSWIMKGHKPVEGWSLLTPFHSPSLMNISLLGTNP